MSAVKSLIDQRFSERGEGASRMLPCHHNVREQPPEMGMGQPRAFPFPPPPSAEPQYRSPESVEMDEIMAAMVLTSLSFSPVIQSPNSTPRRDPVINTGPDPHRGPGPQTDLVAQVETLPQRHAMAQKEAGPERETIPSCEMDMECGGGELSDSGSSGYWSWEHGSVSPALSPSISDVGHLLDEGLHMELETGPCDHTEARRCKRWSRAAYQCLWPSCGRVLASRVGMKRHIRTLHLGSEQSRREEDFYYTELCSAEDEPEPPSPLWFSCSSTYSQQVSPSSILSQSAPSSVWQIHTEHLYQIAPLRSRSISVGEQCPPPDSVPASTHIPNSSPSRVVQRKGRGEAKKCRKVYGVEHRDEWCTACRWKKACQRFPD